MLKEHVWLKLTMLVMISLLIFSISDFPSVIPSGSQLGTTVQAKGKGHLPNLLDQQIAILVGLDINPNWVKEQSAADSLIYGIVKPDDNGTPRFTRLIQGEHMLAVPSLCIDRHNRLWIATDGNGVYRYDLSTGKYKHFVHHSGDTTTISNWRPMPSPKA